MYYGVVLQFQLNYATPYPEFLCQYYNKIYHVISSNTFSVDRILKCEKSALKYQYYQKHYTEINPNLPTKKNKNSDPVLFSGTDL